LLPVSDFILFNFEHEGVSAYTQEDQARSFQDWDAQNVSDVHWLKF